MAQGAVGEPISVRVKRATHSARAAAPGQTGRHQWSDCRYQRNHSPIWALFVAQFTAAVRPHEPLKGAQNNPCRRSNCSSIRPTGSSGWRRSPGLGALEPRRAVPRPAESIDPVPRVAHLLHPVSKRVGFPALPVPAEPGVPYPALLSSRPAERAVPHTNPVPNVIQNAMAHGVYLTLPSFGYIP